MIETARLTQTYRPRPTSPLLECNNSTIQTQAQECLRVPEEKIQASFLNCSIEEEDILDNIEPTLLHVAMTDTCSSRFSSDIRSLEDCFDTSIDSDNRINITENLHLDQNHNFREDMQDFQNCLDHENVIPTVNTLTNSCDNAICNHDSRSKLSLSMHDISNIASFPLVSKSSNLSSETIQSQSITTVASVSKSKDSGFPRSLSCLSLNSGRSYDHVQSKVKEYIKQIKASNKTRRKLAYDSASNVKNCHQEEQHMINEESTSPHVLVPIINKLRDELEEKDRMLATLQENYDSLLMKYAAAENRIDHLRVNSVGNSFNITPSDYNKPKASPNMLLLPNLYELQKTPYSHKPNLDKTIKEQSKHDSLQSKVVSKHSPKNIDTGSHSMLDNEYMQQESRSTASLVQQSTFTQEILPVSHKCDVFHQPEEVEGVENDLFGYLGDSESLSKDQKLSLKDEELTTEPLNHQLENTFVKVKRWQESLPTLDLIEPSSYEQFSSTTAESNKLDYKKEADSNPLLNVCSLRFDTISKEREPFVCASIDHLNTSANTQLISENNDILRWHMQDQYIPQITNNLRSEDTATSIMNGKIDNVTSFQASTPVKCFPKDVKPKSSRVDVETFGIDDSTLYNFQVETHGSRNNLGKPVHTSMESKHNMISSPFQENNVTLSTTLTVNTTPAQKDTNSYLTAQVIGNMCRPVRSNLAQKYLPPINSHSTLTSVPENNLQKVILPTVLQPISRKPLLQSNLPILHQVNVKENEDNNDLYQKRLIGERTRILLTEYLKNSYLMSCNSYSGHTCNNYLCKCSTLNKSQINLGLENNGSFVDKSTSLNQCLDEMNQCAQKLRGKSEAILQVLAKQLKDT